MKGKLLFAPSACSSQSTQIVLPIKAYFKIIQNLQTQRKHWCTKYHCSRSALHYKCNTKEKSSGQANAYRLLYLSFSPFFLSTMKERSLFFL